MFGIFQLQHTWVKSKTHCKHQPSAICWILADIQLSLTHSCLNLLLIFDSFYVIPSFNIVLSAFCVCVCVSADVVYIGVIHPYHLSTCLLFMNAKKNVLCEKPLAMNAKEAKQILASAKENDVFFMEVRTVLVRALTGANSTSVKKSDWTMTAVCDAPKKLRKRSLLL